MINSENSFMFNELSMPMVLPNTRIKPNGNEVIFFADKDEYALSEESAILFQAIFDKLDGTWSIAKISEFTHYPIDNIIQLLDFFSLEGLVIDININRDLSGRNLVSLVKNEASFWRKHINNQPFWQSVHRGECSAREIHGWGIEFYHYVDAANEYMANGVAYCRDTIDIRQKLSAQYSEEADHGEFFLQGLEKDGFTTDGITKSPPLPSTRALINYLNEVAMESTMVYASVFSLMQSDGIAFDEDNLKKYYGDLINFYPFASGMFTAFLKHASIDARHGHQISIFEKLYNNDSVVSATQVQRVISTIRQLARYFILFYDYISHYYSQKTSQLPRRSPRISDFSFSDGASL